MHVSGVTVSQKLKSFWYKSQGPESPRSPFILSDLCSCSVRNGDSRNNETVKSLSSFSIVSFDFVTFIENLLRQKKKNLVFSASVPVTFQVNKVTILKIATPSRPPRDRRHLPCGLGIKQRIPAALYTPGKHNHKTNLFLGDKHRKNMQQPQRGL